MMIQTWETEFFENGPSTLSGKWMVSIKLKTKDRSANGDIKFYEIILWACMEHTPYQDSHSHLNPK